ncbi:MAG TPA: amidohydrolase family protein [Pirellulaceae bacterium]|nr:amidohydrolase family protein [Pirellulaceae bacterium]
MYRLTMLGLLIPLTLTMGFWEIWCQGQEPLDRKQIIENVRVVDVAAGTASEPQRVLIVGTKIAAIGEFELPPGEDAIVIDAEGRYLIPGLFDAHVHLVSDLDHFAPLLVAHGVTSVRDMGGPTELILGIKRSAADSSDPIPDITATGAIIDGPQPVWPFSEPCESVEQAEAAVKKLVAAGVDQIKVYSLLPADAYRAAVRQAHRLGLKVTGHVPYSVSLADAAAAGQNCIEHLEGFGPLLSELTPRQEESSASSPMAAAFQGWSRWREVDRDRLREAIRQQAIAQIYHCPTLVVMHSIGRIGNPDDDPRRDPRMKYVSPSMLSFWDSGRYGDFSPRARAAVPAMKELVGEMYREHVTLVVGTDLANPFVFAGSAVHDEMEHFVEAGIPPAEVLKMATYYPAHLCGVADERGSIETGKTASLVLLDANPLEQISAVRQIRAVWLRGKHFDRAALDDWLAQVERSARGAEIADNEEPKASLPGQVIARGQYRLQFGQFDAGVEEFIVTRSDTGFHTWSHQKPKGGGQVPAVTTSHFTLDSQFVSATWETFDRRNLRATYRIEEGALIGQATQQGNDLGSARHDLTPPVLISTPVYAAEFAYYGRLTLEPGESIEVQSVGFGYPDWKPAAAKVLITRLPDEALELEGRTWMAWVYQSDMKTEMGEMKIKTWTDSDGHTLKSVLRFPFGTVTAVRQLEQD